MIVSESSTNVRCFVVYYLELGRTGVKISTLSLTASETLCSPKHKQLRERISGGLGRFETFLGGSDYFFVEVLRLTSVGRDNQWMRK